MFEGKRVSVVVPAFNEARLIGRVLSTMPDFVDEVVVVDDASSDGTVEATRAVPQNGHALVLVRHERNRGVGAAIRTGYLQALDHGTDVVAVMAGDGQMDPRDLERVIAPVVRGGADYTKGNRLIGRARPPSMPLERYLGTLLLTRLTRFAAGYSDLHDSQSGYTAISSECLRAIPLFRLWSGYGYPNHLLILLGAAGMRVVDVPIRAVYGEGAVSDMSCVEVAPRLAWMLGKGALQRLWKERRGLESTREPRRPLPTA